MKLNKPIEIVSPEWVEENYKFEKSWSLFCQPSFVRALGEVNWVRGATSKFELVVLVPKGDLFSQYNGVLYRYLSEHASQSLYLSHCKFLFQEVVDFIIASSLNTTNKLRLSLHPDICDIRPFTWLQGSNVRILPQYSAYLDDLDELFYKKELQKKFSGEKTIATKNYLSEDVDLLIKSWKASRINAGTPIQRRDTVVMEKIANTLIKRNSAIITVSEHNGDYCTVFCAFCKQTGTGYMLFSGSTARVSQLSLHAWKAAIQWISRKDVRVFDMLNSNNWGTAFRKASWGAKPLLFFELEIEL